MVRDCTCDIWHRSIEAPMLRSNGRWLVGPSLSRELNAVTVYGPKICIRKEGVHSAGCYRGRNWRTRLFHERWGPRSFVYEKKRKKNKERKREKREIWRKRENEKRDSRGWKREDGHEERSGRDFPSLDPLMALALPRPPRRPVPPRVLSFSSRKKKPYTFAESARRVGRYGAIYKLHVWSRGPPEEVTVLAGGSSLALSWSPILAWPACLVGPADLLLPRDSEKGRGARPWCSRFSLGRGNSARPPVRSSVRLYLPGRALAMSANESGLAHPELAWSAAKIAELRQRLIGVAGAERREARDQRGPRVRIRLTNPREYSPVVLRAASPGLNFECRQGNSEGAGPAVLSLLSPSYGTTFWAKEPLRFSETLVLMYLRLRWRSSRLHTRTRHGSRAQKQLR